MLITGVVRESILAFALKGLLPNQPLDSNAWYNQGIYQPQMTSPFLLGIVEV
jgi:hypothetical protein